MTEHNTLYNENYNIYYVNNLPTFVGRTMGILWHN